MNQRYVPLAFSQAGTSLSATAPGSGTIAPPGYYMLVVKNASGVPSVARWVLVGGSGSALPPPPPPPPPGAPTAGFTGTPTSGTAPLTVAFTDQSTGAPTAWAWDFNNDGTVDSTAQNPTFTYNSAGTYTVTLKASNASGSNTATKSGYITVASSAPAPPPGPPPPILAVADAQVKSTSAATNYGTLAALQLRQGTATTPATYHSYLRFNVTGLAGKPSSAKLRLWVTDAGPAGGSAFSVSNTWSESTITWNNAPPITGLPLSQVGSVVLGTWAEFNVTAAVAGNGDVSFGLTTNNSNSAIYASKEDLDETHRPQLVVTP